MAASHDNLVTIALHSELRSNNADSGPEQPFYKRRRVAVACKSCRRRKSRCDGARPSCSVCVEYGFECTYPQPGMGRGSRMLQDTLDARIQAMEATIADLVHQQRQPPNTRGYLDASEDLDDYRQFPGGRSTQQAGSHADDAVTLDKGSPSSHVSPVDGMALIVDPQRQDLLFFGPSSNIHFLRHTIKVTVEILKATRSCLNGNETEKYRILSPITSPLPDAPTSEASLRCNSALKSFTLPPQTSALRLIKLFFADIGRTFPFVYEGDVVRYYHFARGRQFSALDRPWLALLNVIFALSTYLCAKPHQPPDVSAAESRIFIERSQQLLMNTESYPATIETVQAQLLMVQYFQGTLRSDQVRHLHTLAVQTAMKLGLHSKQASKGLQPLRREVYKRTWFACFIMDRSLSMTFGCAPCIPNERLTLDLPLNRSFESVEHEPELATNTKSTNKTPDTVASFIDSIQLFKIQGDIITRLYMSNIESEPELHIPSILEHILAIEQQLVDWHQRLIPELRETPWDRVQQGTGINLRQSIFDRFSVIMMLRTLNTRLLLHRPVLVALFTRNPRAADTPPSPFKLEEFFTNLAYQSVSVSEKCAIDVVDILHKLKGQPLPWWVSTYYIFNAALASFNCLLLRLGKGAYKSPNTSKDEVAARVVELIAVMLRAIDSLQEIGRGTMSVEKIQRTLMKLLLISMVIGEEHPDYGETVTSAWPGKTTHRSQQHNDDVEAVQTQRPGQELESMQLDFLDPDTLHMEFDPPGFATPWLENVGLFDEPINPENRWTALFPG